MLPLLLSLIKPFEGLHKVVGGLVYPYLCPAGKPTRGYGVLVKSMQEPPVTLEFAEAEVQMLAPGYFELACRISPSLRFAPPEMQAAIADFVYNLGAGKYKTSTLRRRVDAGDWVEVQVELRKWVRGGGRVLPGLVARREAECRMIATAISRQCTEG